jgi:hypothetical protein
VIHSLHMRFGNQAEQQRELRGLLGDELFTLRSGCAWYSLNESSGPYHFPRVAQAD